MKLNYYRNEMNIVANENNDVGNYRINKNKSSTSKSVEYKTKAIGSTLANSTGLEAEVVVSLKHLTFGEFLICLWLTMK